MSLAVRTRCSSRFLAAGLALAVLGLTAACSDDEPGSAASASPSSADNPSATPTPTTSDADPTAPSTTPTTSALPGAATKRVRIKGDAQATTLLTAVRLAEQNGFDRFVLQFDGGLPDVDVRYVRPPVRQDGSGNPVEIDGDAFLEIRTTPAAAVDLTTEDATPTYTGKKRIGLPDSEAIEEAVFVGDFEAILTWALGIDDRRRPFVVRTLRSPTRVVVDVSTR